MNAPPGLATGKWTLVAVQRSMATCNTGRTDLIDTRRMARLLPAMP